MCIVTELSKETLSMSNILKCIDDYSIYSHYIGAELELKQRYSSPLRVGDDNPSFCLYQAGSKIKFKDFAYAPYAGDIFDFVKILIGKGDPSNVPMYSVLRQIDNDFNLGLYQDTGMNTPLVPVKAHIPTSKESYEIQVTSQSYTKPFLDYWKNNYDISAKTLEYYNVKDVAVIHYISKSNRYQVYPSTLCIGYLIGGKYKLYFPYERKLKKFKNNLSANWIEGFLQLKYEKDFVIITKAMKEVIFFREHFDWDAVAGKSENTKVPAHLMKHLFSKYKTVYIWLDKDPAGIVAQQDYMIKYPQLVPIVYPDLITQKDVTDRYKYLKDNQLATVALKEITNLITNEIEHKQESAYS